MMSQDGSAKCLDPDTKQTIDRAELIAVIVVVKQGSGVAVAIDSSRVLNGLHGAAMVWRANLWVNSKGPLSTVDSRLWVF